MRIGVIGGGTWGTTLSIILSANGLEVTWWLRYKDQAERLASERRNVRYLPDVRVPESIAITNDLTRLTSVEGVFVAVPSPAFEETLREMASSGLRPRWLASGVKGVIPVRDGPPLLQSEVASRFIPPETQFCVFSGPNIARNILRGEPTTAVVGGTDESVLIEVQEVFRGTPIRAYRTDDMAGVQVGGAFKNVIAIAAGIVQGLELGSNTLGALMVRGLFEMGVVGRAYGARLSTFWGAAGLGDLVATSFSPDSRNARLGRAIGKGKSLDDALRESPRVAEGVYATKCFYGLAQSLSLDLPITTAVHRILFEGLSPDAAIQQLMMRPLRREELDLPDESRASSPQKPI